MGFFSVVIERKWWRILIIKLLDGIVNRGSLERYMNGANRSVVDATSKRWWPNVERWSHPPFATIVRHVDVRPPNSRCDVGIRQQVVTRKSSRNRTVQRGARSRLPGP